MNNSTRFNWLLYLLIFVISGAGAFLGAYLKKKGENVATKQDLKQMTDIVENIRSKYTEQIESHKSSLQLSNQLKLAALDKRLQKHQEAYTLWRKLIFSIHHDEKRNWEAVQACQNWWEENCLYLGHEARWAFHTAINLASDFRSIPREETKERRELFNGIKMAGDKILEGVKLPSLGEDEIKFIKGEASLSPSQPKTQKPG